ncbi:MAG: type II toxin-antitoxin system VapC family toxin [Chloroflexi bacterium]|nr:type II toxin-antitoxin system VapC family toxin [Chloroflexota bacterium]
MPSSFNYLIDSDTFVGLFLPDDALHTTVVRLFDQIERQFQRLATTNWVVAETATVLSNRDTQATAIKFLTMIEEGEIPVLPITEELERRTHSLFKEQTTKKTSMVDCSNVAVAKHYGISDMLAFDGFYERFELAIQRVPHQQQ